MPGQRDAAAGLAADLDCVAPAAQLLHEWGSSCGGGVPGSSPCTYELLPLEGKVSASGGSFPLLLAGTLGSWGEEASHSAY